jgi:branched-chain amino acid transport system ATP-binding protein
MALLELRNISVRYGRVQALQDVSLRIEHNEIHTVLGANGAGKSTLLRALLGVTPLQSGQILFEGEDISKLSVPQRVDRGLVLVPEGRRILISLSVEENLLLGAHRRSDHRQTREEIDAIYQRFPNLKERRSMAASCLSGGEQQMLAVGRAMMARPKLMMLDEPSLGLSPLFVTRIFDLMRELNGGGLAILLVEQNAGKALALAHKASVLELGKVTMAGDPTSLAADPRLREAYLGGGEASTGTR